MKLLVFTEEAYQMLKSDKANNRARYYSNEKWLDDYFLGIGMEDYLKETTIYVPDIQLLSGAEDRESKNREDLNNIKTIYSEYKDKITPMQAADPRMWSALCHIEYDDYIRGRWGAGKDPEDESDKLEDRFFLTNARSSMLYYNALSRLWWSGYLTHEPDNDKGGSWTLTNVLLSAQQIQKDLFDSSFSMNRKAVKGVLTALGKMQDKKGNACTKMFRDCCFSCLNHYGAVSILDSLEPEEIEELAFQYMESYGESDE